MSFSSPSSVVNFPPSAPMPSSNSRSGISTLHVSDCKGEHPLSPRQGGLDSPWTPHTRHRRTGQVPRALHLQDIPGHVGRVRNPEGDPGALRFNGSSRLHLGTPGSELHYSHSGHTTML